MLGAELLMKTIVEIASLPREKQNNEQATLAPILKKEDGQVDWARSAQEIYNRWRGFNPWPGAYTGFRGQQLSIVRAQPAEISELAPGELRAENRRLIAGCGGKTALELTRNSIGREEAHVGRGVFKWL